MRPHIRSLILASSSLGLVVPGCGKKPDPVEVSADGGAPKTPPADDGMADDGKVEPTPMVLAEVPKPPPPPLELPPVAPIMVHLAEPEAMLEGLRTYVPGLPPARTLLETMVSTVGGGDLDSAIVAAIDLRKPWDLAAAHGELIVRVPLLPRRARMLGRKLGALPPAGGFGAVDLQRGSALGPKLGWLDAEESSLVLASTERGLTTGSELAGAYGTHPLRVELDGAEVRKYVPDFRFDSLSIEGAGAHDFEATAEGISAELLEPLAPLQPGALTGLLETERIAVGASSKYRDHEEKVAELLAKVKDQMQISKQNALVRPSLEDLHKRMGRVLAHWNGRTVMGVGPANHLLLALGADDPKKMRSDTVSLLQDVASKLDFVHSIVSGLPLPRVRFQAAKTKKAGLTISVFALEEAAKHLPKQYHPLIDSKGDLRVAMAFSARGGAAIMVVGAGADGALGTWLEDTAKATTAKDSAADVLAVTLALGYEALLPILQKDADPFTLMGMSADREPTLAVFGRDGTTVTVRVKGPAPAP